MSINSVSSIGSFTGCQSSNLSEETKRKLRELGVEPSTVANEFQAQQLIKILEQKLEQVHKSASLGNARKATTGEAELIAYYIKGVANKKNYFVRCEHHCCKTMNFRKTNTAIEAWNRRAQ